MAANRDQIISAVDEILNVQPLGVRTRDLIRQIRERLPQIGIGNAAIHSVVLQYVRQADAPVYQPARGLYRHKNFQENSDRIAPAEEMLPEKIDEEKFYEPFRRWLVEDLEECTKAVVVGGSQLKDKFGTPDVIGVLRPRFDDIIPSLIEIVSVEIKVSPAGLITAFGQACSYMLFSHKSYIVVPAAAPPDDIDRLESLSLIVGIGLILFDSNSPDAPNFEIRARARKHEPDMFYVNQKLKPIGQGLLD